MSSKAEILKIAEENASIAKYLKPEAQAEVLAEEEKIQKAVKSMKGEFKEDAEVTRRLVDIVAQNIDISNQPIVFSLETILKNKAGPIVETNIQKINQLNEIIDKLEDIQCDLEDLDEGDCTEEEWDKQLFYNILLEFNHKIFKTAQKKIQEELIKLSERITKYIENFTKNTDDYCKIFDDFAKNQDDLKKFTEDLAKNPEDFTTILRGLSKILGDFSKNFNDFTQKSGELRENSTELSIFSEVLSKNSEDISKFAEGYPKLINDLSKFQKDLSKFQKDLKNL